MSHCLLAAATPFEIAPFLEHYRANPGFTGNKMEIDVLITGIGLTATTYSLTRQVALRRPDFIVQAGIAGCFDSSIVPGTVFGIGEDTIADLGVIEKGELRTIFDLKLSGAGKSPFTKGWLKNGNEIFKKLGLRKVRGISVNEISSSKKKIGLYREKFNPIIESMEGAALHYVGLMEKIPFLQLRSISNYVGERNRNKWHMKEAITSLNNELISLFNNKNIFKP